MRRWLTERTAATLGLYGASLGFGLISTLLLARALGPSDYGVYVFAMAWVGVLVVPGKLGTDELLTREVAAYRAALDWGALRGIVRWGATTVLWTSLLTAVLAAGVVLAITDGAGPRALALLVVFLILPLEGLTLTLQGIVRGLQRVVLAQVPIRIVRPAVFAGVVGSFYVFAEDRIGPVMAVGLQVTIAAVGFVVMSVIFRRTFFSLPAGDEGPRFREGTWWRGAFAFALLSGIYVVNSRTDIIMLGLLSGSEEAGIYGVASRGSDLVALPLTALLMGFGPLVSSLAEQRDIAGLRSVLTFSARLAVALGTPLLIVFGLAGRPILGLFGEGFEGGWAVLMLLGGGQLLNASFGAVGTVLTMTGRERITAMGMGGAAIANVLFNLAFIPLWGMEGAAIATVMTMVFWNAGLWGWTRRRMGLDTSVIGMAPVQGVTL